MKAAAAALAAAVALMLGGLVAVLGLAVALVAAGAASPSSADPSQTALADIPAELLGIYQQAAEATCSMPWQVLAAVGKVETDHGRSTLPGVRSGANQAGAMGPMQFLYGTWASYRVDGDGDGTADVYNQVDAIWGAARYLCASGAGDPGRLRSAIWAYNHAGWYVDQVLAVAAGYSIAATVGAGDATALLNNPNLTLSPNARQDLAAGIVDQRAVDFLAWASQDRRITVSVIRTGHSQFVAGTNRVSNHWEGRGVDVSAVDGQAVTRSSEPARALAVAAAALVPPGRPTEIGVPWSDLEGGGVFSDGDHQNHIHVGWR